MDKADRISAEDLLRVQNLRLGISNLELQMRLIQMQHAGELTAQAELMKRIAKTYEIDPGTDVDWISGTIRR